MEDRRIDDLIAELNRLRIRVAQLEARQDIVVIYEEVDDVNDNVNCLMESLLDGTVASSGMVHRWLLPASEMSTGPCLPQRHRSSCMECPSCGRFSCDHSCWFFLNYSISVEWNLSITSSWDGAVINCRGRVEH